jgi:signal transduction histidine kinase/DNA-binding LacI/PurR family transcriptional regulator/CheY-like chemotaxis protein
VSPTPSASPFRRSRPTIGVLCGWQVSSGRLDAYLETVLTGLADSARELGCNLMIATGVARENTLSATAWPAVRDDQRFTPVGPWNTDGLVVINPLWSDDATADVARWQREGHPVTLIGRGCDGPTVVADNHGGMVQAVEHLAAHGHRRIAFLYATAGDGPERRSAYEHAVARLGLDADPRLLADAAHEPTGGSRAIDEILDRGVEFTAVLASNESSGRGALNRLQELGRDVPGDVALVGYDDFLEALSTDPAMTCVRQPIDGVARRALEVVLAQIEGDAEPEPLSLVPTTLSMRESCGCTPVYDGATAERGRREIARRIVLDGELAHAMSAFAGRLLAIPQLDMLQLGRILLETGPSIGLSRALVGVYEAEADDPVAWTVAQPGLESELMRFASRSFPPAELVDDGDVPFQLIVIPLHLHEEKGFVALSTERLAFCVAIAAQAEGTFESARNQLVREEAEAALAASEEQLRQAQKMEAVGRLAGGIAHDFNNLLTAISGYTEIVLRDLREGGELDPETLREQVEMIGSSSARAASLTRQLLAFSRRQIMQPVVLDVNEVVAGAHALLERLLGDDVALTLSLDAANARVKVDRNQLEQVIVNLAVNAREAMPAGGTVSLSTGCVRRANGTVPAGEYVALTVSDTGIGMDETTLRQAFEPFFTTKPEGTGLGLATAYGIVKQSGGEILVASAPQEGSVFTVHLPRVADEVAAEPEPDLASEPLRGGTVLLVEDEEGVRTFVAEVLRHGGLDVLVAADATEALALSRAHPAPIDALVTDVVMPAMNGRDLAVTLVAERPALRVLFISGYAEEAIFDDYTIAPSTAFLAKPFSGEALLSALGDLLAEAAPHT